MSTLILTWIDDAMFAIFVCPDAMSIYIDEIDDGDNIFFLCNDK